MDSRSTFISFRFHPPSVLQYRAGHIPHWGRRRRPAARFQGFGKSRRPIGNLEVHGRLFRELVHGLQAEQVFDGLEAEVKKSLATDYGRDEQLTSLWNATMEGVRPPSYLRHHFSFFCKCILNVWTAQLLILFNNSVFTVPVLWIQELHRFWRLALPNPKRRDA